MCSPHFIKLPPPVECGELLISSIYDKIIVSLYLTIIRISAFILGIIQLWTPCSNSGAAILTRTKIIRMRKEIIL